MRRLITLSLCFSWMPGIIFGQRLPDAAVPEEIFYNGKVITVDSAFHI